MKRTAKTGRVWSADGDGPGVLRRVGAAEVVGKRLLFAGFVAALGVQRLFEIRLSRRNERQILDSVGASTHPKRIPGS